jgi:hypothetical protein
MYDSECLKYSWVMHWKLILVLGYRLKIIPKLFHNDFFNVEHVLSDYVGASIDISYE